MEPLKIHLPVNPLITVCLRRRDMEMKKRKKKFTQNTLGPLHLRARTAVKRNHVLNAHLRIHFSLLCIPLLLSVLVGESAFALPSERHLRHPVTVREALWGGRGNTSRSCRGILGSGIHFSRRCHWRATLKKMGLHQFAEGRRHLTVIHAAAIYKNRTDNQVYFIF